MVAHRPDAVSHRACRGDFLARICAGESLQKMERQCRLYCNDAHLCACACRLIQLHAHHGGTCGRRGMGFAIPSVPEKLCGDNHFARVVGCGGVCVVSDNVKLFKRHDFVVTLANKILIYV